MDERVVIEQMGEAGIAELVADFYRRMRQDDLVGKMYPDDDWEGSEKRLADFLIYRFGGSDRYIQERGHPRLRMRHMPFSIGEAERERWTSLMGEAMNECGIPAESREILTLFFHQTADFMRNRSD